MAKIHSDTCLYETIVAEVLIAERFSESLCRHARLNKNADSARAMLLYGQLGQIFTQENMVFSFSACSRELNRDFGFRALQLSNLRRAGHVMGCTVAPKALSSMQ